MDTVSSDNTYRRLCVHYQHIVACYGALGLHAVQADYLQKAINALKAIVRR